MEDFSLNLLCRGQSHLLPSTLDSLKLQDGSFEIILLDAEGTGRLHNLAGRYEGLKIRVENAPNRNLAEMMNLGVELSRGKYIQFLEPGDRYISQYGLSYLTELIQKEPEMISAIDVSREARCHWFLKSNIIKLGGFDEHLSFRPMLDLLCRFEKEGIEPLSCGRVLVDSPKEVGGPLLETCKILYRYFGFKHTLKWLAQRYSGAFQRVLFFFKEAFWQSPHS